MRAVRADFGSHPWDVHLRRLPRARSTHEHRLYISSTLSPPSFKSEIRAKAFAWIADKPSRGVIRPVRMHGSHVTNGEGNPATPPEPAGVNLVGRPPRPPELRLRLRRAAERPNCGFTESERGCPL